MENTEINAILFEAIKTWGNEAQIDMAIEECSELIKALCKLKRAKSKEQIEKCEGDIIDEVADVELMCQQLSMMFSREAIEARKVVKIIRLKSRLKQFNS